MQDVIVEAESPERIAQWRGNIPIHHRYTVGVAGQRFFAALRDEKVILASRCEGCGDRFLLPKIYCERCFVETPEWSRVEGPGYVKTFTLVHRNLDEEALSEPVAAAVIGWEGVRGGIVHRLGGIESSQIRTGMKVEPQWREVRTGSIQDILFFKPVDRPFHRGGA